MVDTIVRKNGRWELRCDMKVFKLKGLTTTEKLVYLALLGHASEKTSTAYPSNKTLADCASCCERQISRVTARLVECHLLTKTARFNERGEQIGNLYEVFEPEDFVYVPPKEPSKRRKEKDDTVSDRHDTQSRRSEKAGDSTLDTESGATATTPCLGGGDTVSSQEHTQDNIKHIPPIIPPTEPEPQKPQAQEEQPLELSPEKPTEKPKRASRKAAEEYTPEFEEFWSVYPTYGRRKKAAFDAWRRLLRLKAATPAVLIHAARRYADMCRATCKEEQYTLHAASFLGPVKEAWKDYIGPEVQMGRTLKDVDKNQFRRPDGSIDYKAYERARRGLC